MREKDQDSTFWRLVLATILLLYDGLLYEVCLYHLIVLWKWIWREKVLLVFLSSLLHFLLMRKKKRGAIFKPRLYYAIKFVRNRGLTNVIGHILLLCILESTDREQPYQSTTVMMWSESSLLPWRWIGEQLFFRSLEVTTHTSAYPVGMWHIWYGTT